MTFVDLGLSPETLQAVADAGYTDPTPIQAQAIPVVLMGRDVLGLAQTGTGKTASFTLPMIDILAAGRARARMPRSLILTPTRELAAQVAENFTTYGKHSKLSMALLVGGESFTDQVRLLDRGVDVLIATPGRMLDLFQRGRILLSDVRIFVIDEADRMLDMGFIPDVERIAGLLPKARQTLFFSATMPPEVKRLADAFLKEPKEVRVSAASSPAETVVQSLVVVDLHDKREALRHLLRREDVKNAFIFCNRKRDIGVLHRSLEKHGFSVAMLHGDMVQSHRTDTLERFKAGETNLLVCSDVAARGLDVTAMSHVFNFDVPIHAEDYIHRIGRTGRAGMTGKAFTIAIPEDGRSVAAIEKLIGASIPRITIEGIEEHELVMDDGNRRHGRDNDRSRGRDRDRRKPDQARGEPRRARAAEGARPDDRRPRPSEAARPDDRRPVAARSEERPGARPSRRSLRDDGTGVAAMEHADDVLGFGDHLPDFFRIDPLEGLDSYVEKPDLPIEDEIEAAPEAVAQQPEEGASQPEVAAQPEEAVQPEEAAPQAEEAAQPEEVAAPEPKKRSRSRKAAAAPAETEAEKPKRRRRVKSAEEAAPSAEAEAPAPEPAAEAEAAPEPAAKPKAKAKPRVRKPKAAATEVAADPAPAAEKPKRSPRRKKAAEPEPDPEPDPTGDSQ